MRGLRCRLIRDCPHDAVVDAVRLRPALQNAIHFEQLAAFDERGAEMFAEFVHVVAAGARARPQRAPADGLARVVDVHLLAELQSDRDGSLFAHVLGPGARHPLDRWQDGDADVLERVQQLLARHAADGFRKR